MERRRRGVIGLVATVVSSWAIACGGARAEGTTLRETIEHEIGIHYGYRAVPDAYLDAMPKTFPPRSGGALATYMPSGGARPDIGLVTGDSAAMLISNFDPRAVESVRATAYASAHSPIHVTDKARGGPPRFDLNAKQSFTDDASNLVPDPQPNPNKLAPDVAHQPHFLYLYGLYCAHRDDERSKKDFAFVLSEMKYWAAWNFMMGRVESRYSAAGIFHPENSAYGERGAAWGLVTLVQLYHLLQYAKDDPWYPSIRHAVEQNIAFLDGDFRTGTWNNEAAGQYYNHRNGSYVNALGSLRGRPNLAYAEAKVGAPAPIAAFQQAFHVQAVLWLYRLSPSIDLSPDARGTLKNLAAFVARWPAGLLGPANDPNAYDYRRAGLYTIVVGTFGPDLGLRFAKDFGEVYRLNWPKPLGPDDHVLREHGGDGTKPLEAISDEFYADLLPCVGLGDGFPGVADGLMRLKQSTVWRTSRPAYQFAILPFGQYFDDAPVARTRDSKRATGPSLDEVVAKRGDARPSAPPRTTPRTTPVTTPGPVAGPADPAAVGLPDSGAEHLPESVDVALPPAPKPLARPGTTR